MAEDQSGQGVSGDLGCPAADPTSTGSMISKPYRHRLPVRALSRHRAGPDRSIAGQIDLTSTRPSIPWAAGTIRAYAVTAKARLPSAPDNRPSTKQACRGIHTSTWDRMWAPKGTLKPVIAELSAAPLRRWPISSVQKRWRPGPRNCPPAQQTRRRSAVHHKAEIEKVVVDRQGREHQAGRNAPAQPKQRGRGQEAMTSPAIAAVGAAEERCPPATGSSVTSDHQWSWCGLLGGPGSYRGAHPVRAMRAMLVRASSWRRHRSGGIDRDRTRAGGAGRLYAQHRDLAAPMWSMA